LLDVAAAVHELKNPAETLTNVLYLLKQNPTLDEKGREYVDLAERELARMRDMLNAMLIDWREGVNPLISVAKVIDGILGVNQPKITFKQIDVEKQYERDALLKADAEDVRQIFANLIMNALEALPLKGKLQIRICSSAGIKEKTGIRVVIADNGQGIAPARRDKVFRDSFTSKGQKGSGLGLWMTAKIVRQYGGNIRFRSSTKQGHSGTVFSVFLPVVEAPSYQQTERTSATNEVRDSQKPIARLDPKENHAIAVKLIAESRRLLDHIRGQRPRLQAETQGRRN
jgi:signal transduction histidine kinase